MKLTILCVGRALPPELNSVADEYEQRLRPFVTIEWKLVKPSSSSEPNRVRDEESAAILTLIQTSDTVLLLDERGQQQTNEAFAATFEQLASRQGQLVIIIGGAHGVNDELRSRAAFVWSLSKLVFPHKLIRVILVEQLYRTYMVMQGHPYHHT